jgi:hypothetical protein
VSIDPTGVVETMTRKSLLAERDRDAARLRAQWAGCANVAEGTCESVKAGEKPDMRLGDVCVLCACRVCERCGERIDLDEELRVVCHDGYVDVCDRCVQDSDRLYDDERNEL